MLKWILHYLLMLINIKFKLSMISNVEDDNIYFTKKKIKIYNFFKVIKYFSISFLFTYELNLSG